MVWSFKTVAFYVIIVICAVVILSISEGSAAFSDQDLFAFPKNGYI